MKLAIMQPYFFPYIGYFQLMNAADAFVIYDNLQYSKKGWINRNRILVNDTDSYITVPLKKDSDYLNINERYLAETWLDDRTKMLSRIYNSYRRAPYFNGFYPVLENMLMKDNSNLFDFLLHNLTGIKDYFRIQTPFVKSSDIQIDHSLKSEEKVLSICSAMRCKTYINPIGGTELYHKEAFAQKGISLFFIKTHPFQYPQFSNDFVNYLSIIDVAMFNSREKIQEYLDEFTLI